MAEFPKMLGVSAVTIEEAMKIACDENHDKDVVRKFLYAVHAIQHRINHYLVVTYEDGSLDGKVYKQLTTSELKHYETIIKNFNIYCDNKFKHERIIIHNITIKPYYEYQGQPSFDWDVEIGSQELITALEMIPSSVRGIMKQITPSGFYSFDRTIEMQISDDNIKKVFDFEIHTDQKNYIEYLQYPFVLYAGRGNTWYIQSDWHADKIKNVILAIE